MTGNHHHFRSWPTFEPAMKSPNGASESELNVCKASPMSSCPVQETFAGGSSPGSPLSPNLQCPEVLTTPMLRASIPSSPPQLQRKNASIWAPTEGDPFPDPRRRLQWSFVPEVVHHPTLKRKVSSSNVSSERQVPLMNPSEEMMLPPPMLQPSGPYCPMPVLPGSSVSGNAAQIQDVDIFRYVILLCC